MTAIYAQGAGLGASKGKEIGTGGDPFDYASSVKSSVRGCYIEMIRLLTGLLTPVGSRSVPELIG
jgi:hypothetical protein